MFSMTLSFQFIIINSPVIFGHIFTSSFIDMKKYSFNYLSNMPPLNVSTEIISGHMTDQPRDRFRGEFRVLRDILRHRSKVHRASRQQFNEHLVVYYTQICGLCFINQPVKLIKFLPKTFFNGVVGNM